MQIEKVNILLVDDLPQNLIALEAVLKNPEYNLICASSGEEALKYILQYDFAVILLDVQMPGLSGFETAKLIKSREKSKNTPIIFVTAINKASEHVWQGYTEGAIDYIFKPFDPRTLKLKIRTFVEMYRSRRQVEIHSLLLEQRAQELEEANAKLKAITTDLARAEALARVIGETSNDTICTTDVLGLILAVNPSVTRMFGFEKEELIGEHLNILFAEEIWASILTLNSSVNESRSIETLCYRKDKSNFYASVYVGQSCVENQNLLVLSIRDITDAKMLEEVRERKYELLEKLVKERTRELSLSEERFRRIFESSPNLISIRSLKDGRVIDVNQSWQNNTGYSRDEMKNRSLTLLFPLDNKQKRKNQIKNIQVKYYTKQGNLRYGLLSTEKIEIEGEECFLNVVTDITERIMIDREITRLDRLHLVGEMAAGIAHEIRNPMTTVHGFLQTLEGKTLSSEYANLMLDELQRANSIITEFLTLAKNKKSDRKLQCLNSIINHLLPLIEAEGLRQDKRLMMDLNECPVLYLDEKEIRQLILNLTLNGLEAMEKGGALKIRTYVDNNDVVLEIIDQGSGIKEDIHDKIGTPFFTTKNTGTGLGLAVCYSVATRHNATVNFISNDTGTTFFVRFRSEVINQSCN